MTTTDTQKWREMSEGIIGRFFSCEEQTECGCSACTTYTYTFREGFDYDDIRKAVALALASVAAEAGHEASQSVLKAVEEASAISNIDDANVAWVPTNKVLSAARLAASNYPAPGEGK